MALEQQAIYTSEDYWNLPDGQRAELIGGQLYSMAPIFAAQSADISLQNLHAPGSQVHHQK